MPEYNGNNVPFSLRICCRKLKGNGSLYPETWIDIEPHKVSLGQVNPNRLTAPIAVWPSFFPQLVVKIAHCTCPLVPWSVQAFGEWSQCCLQPVRRVLLFVVCLFSMFSSTTAHYDD